MSAIRKRGSTRFAPYRRKLLYYEVPEAAYPTGKTAGSAAIDRLHRAEMRAALELAGVQPGDVVLAADADEIPSASSLGLFIGCEGWPSNATTVGLSLERFVFSYYLALREEDSQQRMPTARVRPTPLKNGGDHSFGGRFGPLRNRPPVFWRHFLDSWRQDGENSEKTEKK